MSESSESGSLARFLPQPPMTDVETVDDTEMDVRALARLAKGLTSEGYRMLMKQLLVDYLEDAQALDDFWDKLYRLEDVEVMVTGWQHVMNRRLRAHRSTWKE